MSKTFWISARIIEGAYATLYVRLLFTVPVYLAQKPDIQRCIIHVRKFRLLLRQCTYLPEFQIIVGTVYLPEIQSIVGTVYLPVSWGVLQSNEFFCNQIVMASCNYIKLGFCYQIWVFRYKSWYRYLFIQIRVFCNLIRAFKVSYHYKLSAMRYRTGTCVLQLRRVVAIELKLVVI